MKLGNSGANNKGKKYIKIKPGAIATPENQLKADAFKEWFGRFYPCLQTELINKDTYDEDVLNDTFLRIYDKIRFGGLEIADYKAYFHRAFFTNFMQINIQASQSVTTPLDNHDKIDDSESDEELIKSKFELENDIFDFVYAKYPIHEFELFKMYVRLKPAINYADLSSLTTISQSRISEIISKIRRDVCKQKDFTIRRRSTLRKTEC
ncbi:hypothetical protein [Dysgonomonas sp. HGC4]|uniref:hypothetical protein n=1 Tax=Dysgonomonas sp. HGC4 TaxID=1658009 RepID=UPI0006805355|nr:hypothetical protein [Dysgonomonas sp. HGC4]MBD8349406.1 hypothetical protein [Dysgonomonas sp. HGC4]